MRKYIYLLKPIYTCMKKGSKHSEETKRKMRARANREPRPAEVKEKISETKRQGFHPFRGKELTEEHRRNISIGMKRRRQQNDSENSEQES